MDMIFSIIFKMIQHYGVRALLSNWQQLGVDIDKKLEEGCKITNCPECERECVARPEVEKEGLEIYPDMILVCTECMLRHAHSNDPHV